MFGDLSFSHILILLLVLVLVFGAKRIPEIGSSLGQGIKEFKRSLKEATGDDPSPPRGLLRSLRWRSEAPERLALARGRRGTEDLVAAVHDRRLGAQGGEVLLDARLRDRPYQRLPLLIALLPPGRGIGGRPGDPL